MQNWKKSRQMEYCYQELKKIEKAQQALFLKSTPIKPKEKSLWAKEIEKRIPENMERLFQDGFLKAFGYLFQNGTSVVEKLSQKEKKLYQFDKQCTSLNNGANVKDIKLFDQEAAKVLIQNESFATAEGLVLGVVGIGLPDIVLFLGVLLKTVYEIGFCFGFNNKTVEERVYILTLLTLAAVPNEQAADVFQDLIEMEEKIEKNELFPVSVLEEKKKAASEALASKIVLAKMIQGLPVLGVAGAASNFTLIHRVGQAARLNYKKRFLKKCFQEMRLKKNYENSVTTAPY